MKPIIIFKDTTQSDNTNQIVERLKIPQLLWVDSRHFRPMPLYEQRRKYEADYRKQVADFFEALGFQVSPTEGGVFASGELNGENVSCDFYYTQTTKGVWCKVDVRAADRKITPGYPTLHFLEMLVAKNKKPE